jgi:hypothetical protein
MKKLKVIIPVIAIAIISGFISIGYVLAEKPTADTPESGATSYIKATYDSIVALSHGSVAAGAWGDWGSYWNRIRSAAEWVPSGDAEPIDVASGKKFYKDSRTQATGIREDLAGGCPTQLYHDNHASATKQNTCSYDWPDDASVAGAEKVDPVTGLIWSNLLYRNDTVIEFSVLNNTAFSWSSANANNQGITAPVAGSRTATELCADQGNGWRLPTQKELQQAYIDGAYWNLTQPSNYFWSATENSSTYAWNVHLTNGNTNATFKTNTYQVRCVR